MANWEGETMKNIIVEEAREFIKNKEITIIDVRTPEEFSLDHLEDAINIDIYTPNFKEQISKLDKNKPYLVHCRSGGRSEEAMRIMDEMEFKDVTNVVGFLFPHLG